MSGGRAAVFLDRDGVLVGTEVVDGTPVPSVRPQTLEGVAEACRRLRAAGFLLVMVTNQPDIARARIEAATVQATNERIRRELALDDVRCCPHDDDDRCACRKPAPGMLLDAARDLGVDLARSAMVGDRWRDVEAGQRAGVATVLVVGPDDGRTEPRPRTATVRVGSLAEAVPHLLRLGSSTTTNQIGGGWA